MNCMIYGLVIDSCNPNPNNDNMSPKEVGIVDAIISNRIQS